MPENLPAILGDQPEIDMFMSRKFVRTDWAAVMQAIQEGTLTQDGILAEIKALEPVPQFPTFELKHQLWILQQKLRLILLKDRKPRKHERVPCGCGRPGFFQIEPFYNRCVACAEEHEQAHLETRGNCWYLRPAFDIASRSWGVLFYERIDFNESMIFFVATGWDTYYEALEQGVLPWTSYWAWMWQFFNGSMSVGERYFPWSSIIRRNLPLDPVAWRDFTREQLTELAAAQEIRWL